MLKTIVSLSYVGGLLFLLVAVGCPFEPTSELHTSIFHMSDEIHAQTGHVSNDLSADVSYMPGNRSNEFLIPETDLMAVHPLFATRASSPDKADGVCLQHTDDVTNRLLGEQLSPSEIENQKYHE